MYTSTYANDAPELLTELAGTPELQRLSDVGMHCGCEYANFPLYRHERSRYTRLIHSIGVANIVWHFTGDIKQAVAGLLHDIATPVFAHTIDFLNGDHITQESTEDNTLSFIENSKAIVALLSKNNIRIEDVSDYHKYPIADNDTPLLSADRLEYTLGNGYNVYHMDLREIQDIYNDIIVVKNESGCDELCFASLEFARKFFEISLRNSYLFVSDEDRFAMQYLADAVRCAIQAEVLSLDDLFTTESNVIHKLKSNDKTFELWDKHTKLSAVAVSEKQNPNQYCVNILAKKRYINPLVLDNGCPKRISDVHGVIGEKINDFLALDFNKWVYAIE